MGAACPDEAGDFFAFMTTGGRLVVGPGAALQIMFGVGGEHDLTERELPTCAGWRDSRPVRVGNGAWNQKQIDVYGELLGAAYRLADQITEIDEDTQRFLVACADAAAERWREEDQGIWEVRGDPQHFLYSKVMPENIDAFRDAMRFVESSRRRTGGYRWSLLRSGEVEDLLLESFMVPSWGEYRRQQTQRLTGRDREIRTAAHGYADGEPREDHYFPEPDLHLAVKISQPRPGGAEESEQM